MRAKCCKRGIPDEGKFKKTGGKYSHWVTVLMGLCACGLLFTPEVQKAVYNDGIDYHAPNVTDLTNRRKSIRMSDMDFNNEKLEKNLGELAWQMEHACDQRTDDVVFGFQYGSTKKRRTDHVFMLCKTKSAYANARIVDYGDTYVHCKEEYAGKYREVKRPSSIVMKAIDVDEWESIVYETEDPTDSCILQHAIDLLDGKWTL